jgi:hypothetical protein
VVVTAAAVFLLCLVPLSRLVSKLSARWRSTRGWGTRARRREGLLAWLAGIWRAEVRFDRVKRLTAMRGGTSSP